MKPQEIQRKLEEFKGKEYVYANAIHTVKSYEIDSTDKKFVIKTNLSTYTRKFESADEFFKYWKENNANPVAKATEILNSNEVGELNEIAQIHENTLADELVEILKQNIQKVKLSKEYIPQAKSINNDVNSILHVQRLKLEMSKFINKKNS